MMSDNFIWKSGKNNSADLLLPPLLKMIGLSRGDILDVGCGNGVITAKLIGKGYNAFGIDVSLSGLRFAKMKFPKNFFRHDISSNRALPASIRGIKFDFIISTEVIEHLTDPKNFFSLVRKNLKKNGKLIITTPYHGYLKNILIAITGQSDRHYCQIYPNSHVKFWSFGMLEKHLIDEGFVIERFLGCGRIPFLWKSMMIKARRK